MSTSEKLSRVLCEDCGVRFDRKDAAIKYTKYGSVNVLNKVCPICGGTFKIIELPREFDKYLYVNEDDRYYTYANRSKN